MLQRHVPLLRKTKTPSRRKPLKKISERRKLALYEYGKKRKRFLAARPVCELCPKPSRDVHHVHGRYGSAYLDENTWKALCRACHDWIHQHPKEARERGLLK